jgi:predicted AAA+ superfamily ATPase
MLYRFITKQILEDLKFFPIVGIIGPRQVGKTTLAKYVQKELNLETLYLDLELESDRTRLADAETFFKYHQKKCIVIDEVQIEPRLFPLLRALVDIERRPARFILLGSSSPQMVKGSSESLAGRIAYNELTPFSWLEVSENYSLEDHWLKGGFPEAFLAPNMNQTRRWLRTFIETFIYRDLGELGHQVSPVLITKLLEMLSVLNGNILNMSDLARSLGVTQPTIHRYLDILEGGFIINRLQPYFANVTKRIVKAPKIYIRDSGILHNIANINSYDQLLGHPLVGASWEGYVIEQIRRVVGSSWKFYFYRTHKGAETDLVLITPDGKKICVEIKLSNSPSISQGFYITLEDIKPECSFIIIPNGDSYPKENNIWVCNLNDFLRNKLIQN